MADREKVRTQLAEIGMGLDMAGFHNDAQCVRDALALLREQEPVKPEREFSGGGTTWWNVCGACMTAINPNDKYCHECGRGIKWDA